MTDTAATPTEHSAPGPTPDEMDGVDLETWGMGTNNATGVSNNKLGMWLFLGSDCLLFGALISTYLLMRHRGTGLGPQDVFDIPFTSVSSFVLLMSSMSMVFAVSAISRGEHQRLRLWLLVTSLLGATFIAGQFYEFTAFYNEGLGYTTNLFASAFYSLTGFHGVHVSVGIIMLMSLFFMSLTGRLSQERAETVEIVGLYWHFVDIVWVLIFTIVYLIP
ncbi:MAG: cytochrome c oxidase subunit 3 [Acidimicrobiales bacterium]|nr:cytochrome c oxidase subunit 3 [Acidimicrobiales bacterium]